MQEAVGLLNGAFANLAIKGQKVGLPAPGNMPAFALRRNAGGGGKAGKATGEGVGVFEEGGVIGLIGTHTFL
jgi:hypothetical protein